MTITSIIAPIAIFMPIGRPSDAGVLRLGAAVVLTPEVPEAKLVMAVTVVLVLEVEVLEAELRMVVVASKPEMPETELVFIGN